MGTLVVSTCLLFLHGINANVDCGSHNATLCTDCALFDLNVDSETLCGGDCIWQSGYCSLDLDCSQTNQEIDEDILQLLKTNDYDCTDEQMGFGFNRFTCEKGEEIVTYDSTTSGYPEAITFRSSSPGTILSSYIPIFDPCNALEVVTDILTGSSSTELEPTPACAHTMAEVQSDIKAWVQGLGGMDDSCGNQGATRNPTSYYCNGVQSDGAVIKVDFVSSNLEPIPRTMDFYYTKSGDDDGGILHDTFQFGEWCTAMEDVLTFYNGMDCLACDGFKTTEPPANSCNMDDVQAEIKPWLLTKGVDGCGAGTRQATSYTCSNDGYYDDNWDGALLKVDFVSSNLEKVPQTMDFYYTNGDDIRHNTHTFEEPCNAIAELSSFFDNDCNACDGFGTDAQCDFIAVHENIRSFMDVQGFQCQGVDQGDDASNYRCNPETILSDGTTKVAKRPDGSTFELEVTSNAGGNPMGIALYYIGGRGGATRLPQAFDDPCNASKEVEDFVQAMYDKYGMGEDEFAEDPPPANSCNMDDVQAEIKPWLYTKGISGCGAGTRQATSYTCSGVMSKVVFESSNLEKVPQTMDFYYENGDDVRHNTHTFEEPCNAIAELSNFFDNDCYACDGFMTDAQCDAMAVHEKIRSFMNVQGFQCQDEDASNYSCNPETTLSDGTTKVAKRPDGSTFELEVTSNADGSPLRIGLNYIGGRGGAAGDEWNFEDPCQALVEVEDFVQAMYDEYGMGEDEFAKSSNEQDNPVDADVVTESSDEDASTLSEGGVSSLSSSSSLSALMTMHLATRIAATSVVTAIIVYV